MGKLRDQMVMDMKLKGMSPKTISCYVGSMKAVAAHFGKSPADLSDDEIREYLHYLMEVQKTMSFFRNSILQISREKPCNHAVSVPCARNAIQLSKITPLSRISLKQRGD